MWSGAAARELWTYGRPGWLAANLTYARDHIDDLWIGLAMGSGPLGFYSKAYELAHYPRRVFANPVVGVFTPVLARLQGDRARLSAAFSRAASLVLHLGLFTAGACAAVIPEFIDLVIGARWRPMMWSFRLLLIYAALDPLMVLVTSFLLVTGRPRELVHLVALQLCFFVPALVIGAKLWGINGVAAAASAMLVLGLWAEQRRLPGLAGVNLGRLALWPVVALATGASAVAAIEYGWSGGALACAATKLAVFAALFALVLAAGDPSASRAAVQWLGGALRSGLSHAGDVRHR
jgi:PST family polysaccharide transporter